MPESSIILSEASGAGDAVATDLISGKHHQSVKLMVGGTGATEGWVSNTNPLPVYDPPRTRVKGVISGTSDEFVGTSSATLSFGGATTNASRTGFSIFNSMPSASKNIIYVNELGETPTIANSYALKAGQLFEITKGCPTGAIKIFASKTNTTFVAREW